MLNAATSDRRGAVAAQLYEAATSALEGDGEGAKARIARAIALLYGEYDSAPVVAQLRQRRDEIARGGLAPWQVRRIVAYVEQNLTDAIPISNLAQLVGLSHGHFSRAFKISLGQTAHAYVMRRRVEVAQGMMLTTCEPLSQIAAACGMADQAHFSRLFRQVVGETPNAWRRARRGAIAA
jgi:transcriptional regulator GlxA family with amidase domain